MPAAARYISNGAPSPPAPMTSTDEFFSLFCPVHPLPAARCAGRNVRLRDQREPSERHPLSLELQSHQSRARCHPLPQLLSEFATVTDAMTICAIRSPRAMTKSSVPMIDQRHLDLTAIIPVDGAGCVENRDAMLDRKARARPHLRLKSSGKAMAMPVATSARAPGFKVKASA